MSGLQNEMNKCIYYFETTIYDLLKGFRIECDKLSESLFKASRTVKRGIKKITAMLHINTMAGVIMEVHVLSKQSQLHIIYSLDLLT